MSFLAFYLESRSWRDFMCFA